MVLDREVFQGETVEGWGCRLGGIGEYRRGFLCEGDAGRNTEWGRGLNSWLGAEIKDYTFPSPQLSLSLSLLLFGIRARCGRYFRKYIPALLGISWFIPHKAHF
jgi:hypothetical protein